VCVWVVGLRNRNQSETRICTYPSSSLSHARFGKRRSGRVFTVRNGKLRVEWSGSGHGASFLTVHDRSFGRLSAIIAGTRSLWRNRKM
jgi:hypothetical protein